MSSSQQLARQKRTGRRNLWFERLMAIAATVNLGLVLFNLSYVPWRDFYLRKLPGLSRVYDPLKGIEPYRDTQEYLETVNALENQVSQTGLQSPQAETLLEELRSQSVEIIETNPFAVANKSGTLEKIKDLMRKRIYGTTSYRSKSAKQAFRIFWSPAHLSAYGWKQEIGFFDKQIRPLIQTNYFRQIGEDGNFVDLFFWQIDIWFALLFGVEFLARTFYISRSHTGVSWIDAMLWRWYDIFLLLPVWRWLRVIPVAIRLHQAELLDLNRVQKQINQGLIANFAEELTQVVVVRVINQIQGSIERGEVTRWLLQGENRRQIQINDVNEVEAIANLLMQLTVYQVLPKIQPDIEASVRHNIEGILNQLPLYSNLQNLPGLGKIPIQLTEQLATQLTQTTYNALVAAVEDPVGAKLSSQLVQHFNEALGSEVQKKQTLDKIQDLVSDMLEQVKFNYVKRLAEEDVEKVLEETRHLRSKASVKQTVVKDPQLPSPK